MKTLEASVEAINNDIELIVLGDVHIGSPNFSDAKLKEAIDYILEKENRYVILNGDIVDCTFKDSVGNVYENAYTPSVALALAVEYLKPLAEKGRILCSVGGNHDHDRSSKLIDISIAQQLATMLGIADKYSADSVVLFLKAENIINGRTYKNAVYTIFCSHGNNGGGGTIGSKANALQKMENVIVNADVYIHSHTHSPMVFKDNCYFLDHHKKIIVQKDRLFINTNAFLNYFNSYGEKKLLKPQSMSLPVIKLRGYRDRSVRKNNQYDRFRKYITCEL